MCKFKGVKETFEGIFRKKYRTFQWLFAAIYILRAIHRKNNFSENGPGNVNNWKSLLKSVLKCQACHENSEV